MPGNEELKTTPVHPFLAQRAANSRVNNFYPTARSKPLKRSYADQMASSRPHAVPTTSADSNPVQTPQTQQPSFRYDVPNAAHTQNRQGPSDTARPPPKSGARTSSPWHTARPTGSFRRRKTTKQPQPESESSDHPDSGQSYHSSEESGDRLNSAHQSLPHRTKSTSKRIRQEVHRCAVAANALQMERVQLRREWKKLRGEQATLLQGQRRLRFDWQNLRQERQRNYFRNDDSESMGSSNQSARSSHSDYAEPQARRPQKRQQPEDSDAGRFRPSTPFDQASHQPRLLLEKYNSQWNTLLRSTSPDIPWPTNDLEPASLTKHQHRTPQVIIKSCDPQEVMKWNAFNFFTSAFGIRPTLNKSANKITLGISTAPLEVVKALRQQVREDIKRWHQDKLGCRGAALGSDERAKAVYAAVFELYAVCNERIRRLREI
ncbi:hypothetical protein MMC16_005304 [Acarospora aff. strigata]|nr:hypothetical protein [Acarospora aff. strigata]